MANSDLKTPEFAKLLAEFVKFRTITYLKMTNCP